MYFSFCFCFLSGISIGITSSALALKICAVTTGIKHINQSSKKRKISMIVLLEKCKLNSIKVLFSKILIHLVILHDEFVLINNVLKEYNEMKEELKKFKCLIKFIANFCLFIKQSYHTQKVKFQKFHIRGKT